MDVLNGFFWLVSTALYSAVWLVRFVLTLPLRLVRVGRNRRKAHGSARWAHRWEHWWHGAVRGEGVLLGRGAFGRLLRFSSDGMMKQLDELMRLGGNRRERGLVRIRELEGWARLAQPRTRSRAPGRKRGLFD